MIGPPYGRPLLFDGQKAGQGRGLGRGSQERRAEHPCHVGYENIIYRVIYTGSRLLFIVQITEVLVMSPAW